MKVISKKITVGNGSIKKATRLGILSKDTKNGLQEVNFFHEHWSKHFSTSKVFKSWA